MELSIILIILVVLLLFSVVLIVGPTCVNLFVSYFLAKKITKKYKNKYIAIWVTLALSLMLGLNSRIPTLIDSIFSTKTELNVLEKQKPTSQERIKLISGSDTFYYKKNPLETISVGGNEGCMCFYYKYPKIEKINLKDVLLTQGFPITYTKESRYTVVFEESESDSYIGNININIFKGESTIATARKSYIKSFPAEKAIFDTKSNLSKFTIYLFQHNVWNYIFSMLPYFDTQEDIFRKIITNTFETPTVLKITYKNILKAIPVNNYRKNAKYSLSIGMIGDIISPNDVVTKVTYNVLASMHEETFYPIKPNIPWYKIEKILSVGNYIYVFETQAEEVIIEIYSLRGKFLTSFDVILPEIKLEGAPRKPLTYFEETESGFYFSLLEFGDGVDDKEHIFYVPAPMEKFI